MSGDRGADAPYSVADSRRKSRARPGLRSSVSSWMHKFRANLCKVTSEALAETSGSDSGRSTVDALFDGATETADGRELEGDTEARSSTSQTLVAKSEEEAALGKHSQSWTFETFDPHEQRQVLHGDSSVPFVDGPKLWHIRRELWTAPTANNSVQEAAEHRASFRKIKPHYYPRIYRKLVLDDRPLSQPINLEDVMKIMDAGWLETNKWERASRGLA
ncbi:AER078Wp [Eremothecium gossypii ATCC 10895]|uniref:AER078Wp n=1 Tax=Eremothecium gossypii (strain ATCC 10895 / CBS 109.51 / FGSC 9923 / NRRL Y-1056) TaxID=284811 RepID=Q757D5_EREGS|nr:AER078Wp [Eremothecium gossypii ATCC 10895]AAS52762.1 AER078Wp [Eremothecium gossypii ATCC 10895]AEY97068.1 FAER078Wp [Eremothecium gossypii FDAG1]